MKHSAITLVTVLAALLSMRISVSAADLDNHYLERFGELSRSELPIAGVLQVKPAEITLDRCGTPDIHSLRRDWQQLAVGTQKTLAKYLAKPVLAGEAQVRSAGGYFTIHYATGGSDVPPLADANSNGIPDWVESVAALFDAVYTREVSEMGYTRAPTVGGQPYDVYLQNNVGGSGYLGATYSADFLTPTSATSYIVIDNDFAEFLSSGYTADEFLKITAAHEYHHAIQYGYNYYFDIWYAEATSTWMEDEVFDSVNQLYDYLPGWFNNFQLPLNAPVSVATGGGYARWLLNRSLAENRGTDIVRAIWTRLSQKGATTDGSDIPMIPVLNEVLGDLGLEMISFGKRVASKGWSSHQNEIALIHPLLPYDGVSPLPPASYPNQSYSLAFFKYPLHSISGVDLSGKPTNVLSDSVSTADSDILVLCSISATAPVTETPPAPADDGGGGGGGCFIATAAYGSYLHPKVIVLRQFRDRWLLTNPAGRLLVDCYYRVSPPIAAVIARNGWMRRGCRSLLAPVIAILEHPESFASFAIGFLGWLLVRKRVTA